MSDATNSPSLNESEDGPAALHKPRYRLAMLCVALLVLSSLTGATALSDASTSFVDVAKIVAVVAFIASMIALAISMVGDAYRS